MYGDPGEDATQAPLSSTRQVQLCKEIISADLSDRRLLSWPCDFKILLQVALVIPPPKQDFLKQRRENTSVITRPSTTLAMTYQYTDLVWVGCPKWSCLLAFAYACLRVTMSKVLVSSDVGAKFLGSLNECEVERAPSRTLTCDVIRQWMG